MCGSDCRQQDINCSAVILLCSTRGLLCHLKSAECQYTNLWCFWNHINGLRYNQEKNQFLMKTITKCFTLTENQLFVGATICLLCHWLEIMTAVAGCPGRYRLSVWYSWCAKVSDARHCRICFSCVWCSFLWVAVGSGPRCSAHCVSAVFSLLQCGTYRRGLKPCVHYIWWTSEDCSLCKSVMFILRSVIVSLFSAEVQSL
jgi:hypothetical protein